MLHAPDRHQALSDGDWDPLLARQTLVNIVRDTEQQCSADGRWPLHPLDDEGDEPPGGFKGLYIGRTGVLWALAFLQRRAGLDLPLDPVAAITQTEADYRAAPDGGTVMPSLQLGESGVLLVRWWLGGEADVADRLHAVVAANLAHPSNEPQLGVPGTLVAAWHLWQRSGQVRWRDQVLQGIDALWRTWLQDGAVQLPLWTQDLYGKRVQYLGAGHGWAGNVQALLLCAPLLDPARHQALLSRCLDLLQTLACHHDGAVNWPPGLYSPRPGQPRLLMQWCHGAPGIVSSLAALPLAGTPGHAPALEALLLAAGQAIWRAGPLAKGHGLCHGTAGNGGALLTLYRRSGDPLWLQRARRFAMHAIGQYEQARRDFGRGRYTLWTGDLGLAVYLWQCLQGSDGIPVLDMLD